MVGPAFRDGTSSTGRSRVDGLTSTTNLPLFSGAAAVPTTSYAEGGGGVSPSALTTAAEATESNDSTKDGEPAAKRTRL